MTENETAKVRLLEAFSASDPGRAILRATAKSIEVANEAGRGHWGTTVEKDGAYVALNVGNACAIRLHGDKVRILLFPDRLDAATREALEENASHSWDRPAIPGSRNFELDWLSAAQMWGALEGAHHAVLTANPRRRTTFYKSHSNVVIDALNRTLELQLPYPDYGADVDRTPSARRSRATDGASGVESAFGALIQSVEAKGLHFPTETLANYILALQTKRFAILSGISGTGKTQIAMAVARAFRGTVQGRRATESDTSTASSDGVRMTAWPYHFNHRQIVVPAAFVAEVDPCLTPKGGSNGGTVAVSYPGNRLTELRFYRDPTPGQNQTSLLIASAPDFRDWYINNLQPGDHYYMGLKEGERSDEHRLEFRLAETTVVERDLKNSAVVPVRPDWVDNRGLLGYLNPLTDEYATTPFLSLLLEAQIEVERADREDRNPHPFFVVLDEMNLARVEHYFSDFLSALESDEPIPLHESEEVEEGGTEFGVVVPRQLRVPKNVFFTGTVNVDETTYMFSPKVLDRAFTIEFDRVDLDGYTTGTGAGETLGLDLDRAGGALRLTPYRKPGRKDWVSFSELEGGRFHRKLLELHAVLEAEHRHFGYRVANEIARFVNLAHEQSADPRAAEHAFDLALLQKVLPKFHGTQQELEPILRRLASALGGTLPDSSEDVPAGTSPEGPEPDSEGLALRFPRTGAKIQRMLRRLKQRGFTSFIE